MLTMTNTTAAILKKSLRDKEYVRWWVSAATALAFMGCLFLQDISFLDGQSRIILKFKPLWNLYGWYWVGLLLALIIHVGLLVWGPDMRVQRFVTTKNPPKWMMSVWNLIGVIFPLTCGETIILDDQQKMKFNSFISATLYTLNVFCIYMAFLPAYDYQTVHIAVGIWASISCFLARDIKLSWVRAGFYVFVTVLIFLFLMFHHWVTSETTSRAKDALNDLREGDEDTPKEF